MPAEQIVMAQVNGGNQLTQLLASSGSKTFTVGKVTTAKVGEGMITLTPTTGGSPIAVKLEGARQSAELSSLVGKTVAVSKPSVAAGVGAANDWLMFQPLKAGAAKTAASSATLIKLEGVRQGAQAAALTGKEFTVVKPMMAGNAGTSTIFLQPTAGGDIVALKTANTAPAASSLVGKTVTIGQTPLVAGGNQSNWLVLKSTKAVKAASSAKAASAAAAAQSSGLAKSGLIAKDGTLAMKAAAMKSAGTAKTGMIATKTLAATGTGGAGIASAQTVALTSNAPVGAKMMTVASSKNSIAVTGINAGKSMGLGFLGIGLWGPVILGTLGAAAVYGYIKTKQAEEQEVS